jgi:ABC-type uncharacterized transport system
MTNKQTTNETKTVVLSKARLGRLASLAGSVGLITLVAEVLFAGTIGPLGLLGGLAAMIGFGLWMVLAPDELRNMLTGRQTIYGGGTALMLALFAGIIMMAYSIARTSNVSADFTTLRYYSLKEDVRRSVSALSQPIQISAFYDRSLLGRLSSEAPVLKMFKDGNPTNVNIVYYDPVAQPLIARTFGLTENWGVFVSYLHPDGTPDTRPSRMVKMRTGVVSEKFMAEAIQQLEAQGRYRVVFTTGAGEISLDSDATGIRDGLLSVGMQVETVDLFNNDLPADTTLLVMLGPFRDYPQTAVDKIAAYMAGGGKLLLMAEPAFDGRITFMTRPESPLLVYLRDAWGVIPEQTIAFDPQSFEGTSYYVRPARFLEGHPIVQKDEVGTANRPLFLIAQSWRIFPLADVQADVIYQSSPAGFGKRNLQEVARNPDRAVQEATDAPGPLNLMVAAQNTRTKAKLVAIGDADWVRNDQIVAFDGQILWTNIIDYMTDFLRQIVVNPVAIQPPLNVSSADLDTAALITNLILPGLVLMTGFFVWARRVRK